MGARASLASLECSNSRSCPLRLVSATRHHHRVGPVWERRAWEPMFDTGPFPMDAVLVLPMSLKNIEPAPAAENTTTLWWWLNGHAAVIAVAAVGASVSHPAVLAAPAAASFGLLWGYRPCPDGGLLRGVGLANRLTMLRLVVVLLSSAAMPWLGTGWLLAAFSFNVFVDIADGHVARLTKADSPFGAVFDREVDAVFVLCAYLYFVQRLDGLGAWLLLAGLMPYVYRLAVMVLSAPVPPDGKERLAPTLAAVNFVLILAAFAFPDHATGILVASVSLVLASFSASFWSLYRHAHSFP